MGSLLFDKKTSMATFLVYAMLLTDALIAGYYDLAGKALNSQSGTVLFIAMSIMAFCAGQYVLKRLMPTLGKDIAGSSFFYKMYRATPLIQYIIAAIFAIIIFQLVFLASYSVSLLIVLNTLAGVVGCMFLGFRCYNFFSWYKSNKRNIMTLAFAIAAILGTLEIVATTIVNDWVFLDNKPGTINSEFNFNIDFSKYMTGAQNVVHLYFCITPLMIYLPVEIIAVAFFLRYFIDKIGKATYWTIIILPPALLLVGAFVPQLLTPGQAFVAMKSQFLSFRIMGAAGWVGGNLIVGYAYLLVARSIKKINPGSMVINYMIIAAFASIILGPTQNNWMEDTAYPPFGIIIRGFLPFATLLYSMGIYSAALSVSQDAKLRQSIRKIAESKLLDTIGTAQMEEDIQKRVIKLAREQADTMAKETGAESSMTDDDIKQYLVQVISEVKKKDAK
jgi:hypothetical protein